ncbi:MAG: poly-beta-1,6 N-acetyl-D-glucosamine export porin PgaA, partial [Burkholderiales bacterium]
MSHDFVSTSRLVNNPAQTAVLDSCFSAEQLPVQRPLSLLLPAILAAYSISAGAAESHATLKLAMVISTPQANIMLAQADPQVSSFPMGEAGYQAALQLVREGKLQQAADYFALLRRKHGDDVRVLHDYVAVTAEAGRHGAALAELSNIDRGKAPIYVLEALAASARASAKSPLALQLYDEVLARAPDRMQSLVAKVYTLSDMGDHTRTMATAEQALNREQKNAQLWEAYAYALRKAGRESQALDAYAQMRALDPTGKTADQARINLLSSIGAAHRAKELADAQPDIVSPADQARLRLDRAAVHIRWADADEDTQAGRYRNTDIALHEIDAVLSQLKPIDTPNAPLERRALSDKLVALANRQRYEEATDLYVQATGAGYIAPAYARMAVADAYLGIKRPDVAKIMFEQLVGEEPNNLKYRYGLFYALSDLEQHRAAQDVVDEIVRREPRTLNRNIPELERENPGYVHSRVLAMLARAYADDLPNANRRADELVDLVPRNQDVRANRGYIYSWRGWPRLADEEFRWLLAVAPESHEAKLGRIAALAAINDWEQSDAELAELSQSKPDDRQVRTALRRSAVHHMPELLLNGEAGNSSQSINASQDRRWEARLYSQPISDVWRVYARSLHQHDSLANDAYFSRHRAGIGAEFKARDWLISADATRLTKDVTEEKNQTGVSLNLSNEINDLWRVHTNAESADESLPVRAAAAGIRARRAGLGISTRDNEVHRASVDIQRHNFSDGNRRNEWSANYTNVFETEYQKRYSIGIGLSGIRNSFQGTPYFNPASALAADLSLTGEWLQWREEQKSLWHRV